MDFYGFYTGKVFDAYEYLGAHVTEDGVVFRTFAPAAERISVIAECSDWEEIPMHKVHDGNFWEAVVADAKPGMMYKYRIYHDGKYIDHCDPYGYGMELRPQNASIVRQLDAYNYGDAEWMKMRTRRRNEPLNIYEMHMGSFRKPDAEPDSWYRYEELAELLVPYLKEHGYNYIELMPLNEYPSDESWGYQSTGFFSPTSRYGEAAGLMRFVDVCHQNGIGVLLDFVPVHFAVDDYGLAKYDGTALYEYPNAAVGYSEWGSCNFMHSRGEVRSFLQSAANYWLSVYHMDGIRMDAISRIIYWQGEPSRGVNGNAVDFIRFMNCGLHSLHPTAILAAEDSTSYAGVTKSAEAGGLDFDYKWDMGWMNDTLDFFRTAPEYRSDHYHKLTFSMMYYYDASYLLPLSHDENVHGKATILQKMSGDYEDKFPQARVLYAYMYAHPGKKLNFMGGEIGQLREWDEKREQDWDLLRYPKHDAFAHFMRDLCRVYLAHPALYASDYEQEGFQWVDCHQEKRCIYAFLRTGAAEGEKKNTECILFLMNLSGQVQEDYAFSVPEAESLTLLLDSENSIYGGSRTDILPEMKAQEGIFTISLLPYEAILYIVK